MTILSVEAISKQFGPRPLFEEVSFGMLKGERLGVIGVNGSGKTTLLRVIAGVEPPDSGRVVTANGITLAYLPQAPLFAPGATVLEAVFASPAPTIQLLRTYEQVATALAHQPDNAALITQLGQLTPQMDALGAWEAETAARSILDELGLAELINVPVEALSGGQRKRTAMARALVDRPDLLILDEPTNHIDTDTVAWLEDYLARIPTALLLVTHDRYFLDRLVSRMLELDRGRATVYQGNYGRFLEQKAERLQQEVAATDARKNLLRKELAWLRRGAQGRTTKQKAHVERVYELIDQRPEASQGQVAIDLAQGRRLGKRVVEIKNLTYAYEGQPLINQLNLEIRPGDRLAIIGRNGSGKTTLLNLIVGRLTPDAGEIITGATVHHAYYDQEAEGLNLDQRVVDYIRDAAELIRGREGALVAATQMLERFLFSPEQQWALISTLSGGERRRLYLLRQLIEAPNLLLLDEPTNDLDLQTLTVLEDYLDEFQGAIVVVSHDRYFLDRIAQRTVAFEANGKLREYPGGYTLYRQYRQAHDDAKKQEKSAAREPMRPRAGMQAGSTASDTPPTPTARPTQATRLNYKERRELEQLEASIPQHEAERDQIIAELATTGADYTRAADLATRLAALEAAIETAYTRWAELSERV
ncbi:ABC-F family ATP-binding cassette domain-containing protein [Candidatus Chloroploca asiatica]|uniref:ABC transporter n=1 Tax=Candidatus Chloroploca asiatica TaxID=1506545 RepID=A0A2H3LBI3_9CHLR|nr:ABC-F family ATP-binding cassette domain-containing protein [Candidatus Chloroploca asiatica]PDW00906.1 ABC transporter [Candidatus Chloroploca asiatica]